MLPESGLKPYYTEPHVTIYHGNCAELLRALPEHSVDFVLTDPPYLVGYRGRWCSDWAGIEGDENPDWLLPAFREIWRVLKPNSLCLSFYGWPHADLFLSAWKLVGFRPVSHLVCVKNNLGLGFFSRSKHETAFLLAKGNPRRPDRAVGDVFPGERESDPVHPNQKPLRSISQMLDTFTEEGDVILDPFMGSGTTLVAARNLSRQAIGIDVDEHYCNVAVARLSQLMFDFTERITAPEQDEFTFDTVESDGDLVGGGRWPI